MNKKMSFLTVVILLLGARPLTLSGNEVGVIVEVGAELRTLTLERSQKELLDYIEKSGGWFVQLNRYYLTAYLPAKVTTEEIAATLRECGYLISFNTSHENPAERVNDLQLIIESKSRHLNEVRKLLQGANLRATLDIEMELANISRDIENAKGELAFLRQRSSLKKLTVRFTSEVSGEDGPSYSGFSWLNEIGIPGFLERFEE